MIDPKDGGWLSKKFWLTIHAINVIVGLGLIAAHWAALGPFLQTLVGGVTACLTAYFAASSFHTHVVGKADSAKADP